MAIQTLKLLADFGLVILIWMTQLIVYPSFTYMNSSDLLQWHPKYTQMITLIVMPLMLIQLATTAYQTYSQFNGSNSIQLVLVLIIWLSTFFQAVPLHNKIAAGLDLATVSYQLVRVNWLRTILWSVLFIISITSYLRNFKQLM